MISRLAAQTCERTKRWPFACWYWGDAIAVDGLLAAEAAGLAPTHAHVVGLLERWLGTVPPGYHDALAPGAAIVDLVAQGLLPEAAQDRFLAAVSQLPLLYGEVPALEPHLARFRFGVCIDALYHLPPALAAAGRERDDPALVARAVRMAVQILERLPCEGGWSHWYDFAQDRNNGAAWGRGAGWAALGLLDLTSRAAGVAATDELQEMTGEILTRLVATQRPDGHWGPLLGRDDLAPESSVAAFFLAAALHPAASAMGVPQASVRAAAEALRAALDDDGVYQGVSADVFPDWAIATYEQFSMEPSPWGQGAALRALAAMATSPAFELESALRRAASTRTDPPSRNS